MLFILYGMKRPEHGVVSSFHSCTAASNGSIILKAKHILKELDACGKETLIEAIVIEAIGRALHRDQTRNVRDVLRPYGLSGLVGADAHVASSR